MFSNRYEIVWEQVSELSGTRAGPLSGKLKSEGLDPVFNWRAGDLSGDYRPDAVVCGGASKR
jgi:hypothetical protein